MNKYFFWGGLIFLILLRFVTTRPIYKEGDVVRITGKVSSQPTVYDDFRSLVLEGVRMSVPKQPPIDYGDELVVTGVINGGRLRSPKIQKVKKSESVVISFRKKIIDFYSNNLPFDHAALVSGIVLGDKGSITDDFRGKLTKTGVIHVVVASGMNVTFVAAFLMAIFTIVLKRSIAISFVILGIFVYVVLSGFDAPIIRAAIMGGIAFLAQETGRLTSAWRALVFSAFIMLLVSPSWLGDLGFILSFVATASLLLFQKPIEKRIKKIPNFFKEGLTTSLAAQVGVAPIIFVTFGQFNILSPFINALVLWTVPLIMIIGAVSGVVGSFLPILGKPILYLVYPLTWWFTGVINFFA